MEHDAHHWRGAVIGTSLVALLSVGAADYTVQPGDTLTAVAEREGTTVATLARLNGLEDPDRLLVGQRLTTPVGTASARPAAALERAETGELIRRVAERHGWSSAFVQGLAWQESGWSNGHVSSAGAIGIMQVMPETGRFVSRELAGEELDLSDPHDNVVAGVLFLQYLWELTEGDAEETLAGYYQGLRSVRQHGRSPATERYIDNVLALRERFR